MNSRFRPQELVGILTTRIGRRFVALFVGCTLVPLVLFAWLVLSRVGDQMASDLRSSLQNGAKTAGMGIAARLSQVAGDLTLASDLATKGATTGFVGEHSLEAHVGERCSAIWLVANGDCKRLAGAAPPPKFELSDQELRHLENDKPLVRCTDGASDLLMLKALDAQRPTDGLLVASINREWFWDPNELRTAGCEFLAMIDARQQVLFDTFAEKPSLVPLIQAIEHQKASGSIAWQANSEPHLARYWRAFLRPQYGYDWIVVQSRPERDALQVQHEFVRWFLLTAVGSLLFVLGISLVQMRRTLEPIVELHAATRQVGSGNLDVRVRIRGDDELAALGASFDVMAAALQENVRKREQTERDLVASRDAALAAVRAKAEFVTNVSHEFRTPMTEILSAVEIISQLGPDEEQAREEFSGIALRGGQRLARLVDDVLELGASKDWRLEAVDLGDSIHRAIERMPADVRPRITCELAPGLPPLAGNAERLVETWCRLLDNAAKFSDKQSAIAVRTKAAAGYLVVEIEDHGVGIHLEDQQRVFEPFCQVGRDQLIDKANGTGLGLTLVKSTIERHGGRVELRSEPDRGTMVRIWLPVLVTAPVAVG